MSIQGAPFDGAGSVADESKRVLLLLLTSTFLLLGAVLASQSGASPYSATCSLNEGFGCRSSPYEMAAILLVIAAISVLLVALSLVLRGPTQTRAGAIEHPSVP